jgi:transposase-like protein
MLPVPAPSDISFNCSDCRTRSVKHGYFRRKRDGVVIQRYRCSRCGYCFSDSTLCPHDYRQKKRDLNPTIFNLLCAGVSQRRIALILKINRKTVVNKFILLGYRALLLLPLLNSENPPVQTMEFDDLETFEHSKCKPLSVTLSVEHGSRRILGFRVASMPAKGKLSQIALKKYGPRKDDRAESRMSLFNEIKPLLAEGALIKSDQNPHYTNDVKKHFPGCTHQTSKGRRGCVVGQGELKRGGFDPLFSLNHTCAMLRANINRLFRRTWCTTKLKERLAMHIALYSLYHNEVLIK